MTKQFSKENPPTEAQLREVIEGSFAYEEWIDESIKNVTYSCSDAVLSFVHVFSENGIKHIILDTNNHGYLAVETVDRGTLIFDPTFAQYDREYERSYFLGTPQELMDHLKTIGGGAGLDAVLMDHGSPASLLGKYYPKISPEESWQWHWRNADGGKDHMFYDSSAPNVHEYATARTEFMYPFVYLLGGGPKPHTDYKAYLQKMKEWPESGKWAEALAPLKPQIYSVRSTVESEERDGAAR